MNHETCRTVLVEGRIRRLHLQRCPPGTAATPLCGADGPQPRRQPAVRLPGLGQHKAAYRFFANQRVSEAQILSGHFAATRERVRASDSTVLVLQDTTEFTFQRESREAIEITYRVNSGRDKADQVRMHTLCGLLMLGSLEMTTDGLPLGLAAVKFWSREKFKGTNALKRKINPTSVPIKHIE